MSSSEFSGSSPGWMPRGACRGEDPELFFPVAAAGPALAQVIRRKGRVLPVRGTRRVPVLRPGYRAGRHLGRNHPGGTPRHAAVSQPGTRAQRPPGQPARGRIPSQQPRRTVTHARRRTALRPAAHERRSSPAPWQRVTAPALDVSKSHDEPARPPAAGPGPHRAHARGRGSRPRVAVRVLHHADAPRGNARDRAGAAPSAPGLLRAVILPLVVISLLALLAASGLIPSPQTCPAGAHAAAAGMSSESHATHCQPGPAIRLDTMPMH